MTHDSSIESNIGSTHEYFKENNPSLIFNILTKEDYTFNFDKNIFKKLSYFFIIIPYYISTSKIIFMDNVFLPFAYVKPKKDTKLVQLWHGTGSIKRFGLETETGWIKDLAIKVTNRTTDYIVASSWMKNIYKTAFNAYDNVYNIGCPRTDFFFNEKLLNKASNEFFKEYPDLINKKIILYAPTFRDNNDLNIELDINNLLNNLSDEYILGLRLHPHINHNLDTSFNNRLFDFSDYPLLNTLLVVTDILITDYSSIIFDYSLLKKPILLFAYDLEDFKNNSRGFYEDYETIVPGHIVFTTNDLIELIKENKPFSFDKFINKYLENCDGHSRKRLYELLE